MSPRYHIIFLTYVLLVHRFDCAELCGAQCRSCVLTKNGWVILVYPSPAAVVETGQPIAVAFLRDIT